MIGKLGVSLVCLGLLLAASSAQDERPGGAPQAPEKKASPKVDERARAEIGSLIEKLGSQDYEERSEARRRLEVLGRKALPQLEKAAQDSKDPEVRWNSRKLIRSIESPDVPAPKPRRLRPADEDPGWNPQDLRPDRDPSRGQVKRQTVEVGPDGSVKVTITENKDGRDETRVYSADSMEEFRKLYPGVLPGPGEERDGRLERRPRLPLDGFEDLEGLGERMRKLLERSGVGREGQAEDFEKIIEEQNRRLREMIEQLDGRGFPPGGRDRLRPDREEPQPGPQERPLVPEDTIPPPSERLGVTIEVVDQQLGRYLELPPDTGLLVMTVSEDSLANRLGVRPKDVLVEINGRAVQAASDIRRALRETAEGKDVVLEVIRFAEGRKELKGKK